MTNYKELTLVVLVLVMELLPLVTLARSMIRHGVNGSSTKMRGWHHRNKYGRCRDSFKEILIKVSRNADVKKCAPDEQMMMKTWVGWVLFLLVGCGMFP